MITIPAIKCTQNNYVFYQAVVSSKQLLKFTFLLRRHENKKKGFQRILNSKRAEQIAIYLDEEKGSIPASIIVSAQKESNLSFNSNVTIQHD